MLRRSSFRDLLVWQKSKLLCVELYELTKSLPDFEKFCMVPQIRRAALSVPSNIAEGHGRNSNADFARFLYISLGSIREIESLIEIGEGLGYFTDVASIFEQLDELAKMLSSLIHKLDQ